MAKPMMEAVERLPRLMKSARVAVKEVLALKEGERVLIVTNPEHEVFPIAGSLYYAAEEAGAKPVLMVQAIKSQTDFAEDAVLEAIASGPDVVLSISANKLGKDPHHMKRPLKARGKKYDHIFNYLLDTKKIRSFWSPSITQDMFIRTVPINYRELRSTASRLKKVLDRGESVHITTDRGTDIRIGIQGRAAKSDDGDFTKPGTGGNIPCGEVFISPALGASEGTIVFDGSIASDRGVIVIEEPITVKVKDGFVKSITGGKEARKLREVLKRAERNIHSMVSSRSISSRMGKEYMSNLRNLGELGIGLNPKARIVGNILEDEKAFNTCHIAIGSNYDQDARTVIHLDGIIMKPTLTVQTKTREVEIMKNGKLLV